MTGFTMNRWFRKSYPNDIDPMGNGYHCKMFYKEHQFDSASQAYYWEKARAAGEDEAAEAILKFPSSYAYFSDHLPKNTQWYYKKEVIMFDILMAKAKHCPKYRKELRIYSEAEFKYGDKHPFWGAHNKGKNKLGKIHLLVSRVVLFVDKKEEEFLEDFRTNHFAPDKFNEKWD